MITGHVFIAASLDGFIARPDGAIDWLAKHSGDNEDYGYAAFMASVSGLVMGRGSFEKVLSFGDWPYQKPVAVMSRSLQPGDIPGALRDKVRLCRRSPAALMAQLQQEGRRRAYVDGGKIIQSFPADDLIEDMTITRVPVLLGDGLPLFARTPRDIEFEHMETRAFPSGLVSSRYRRVQKTRS